MQIWKFALIGQFFILGGCAMPAGFTTLTYAMTGLSYASSGKGVADHALSAAIDQDCAVLRAVQGIQICGSANRGDAAGLMTMIDSETPTEKQGAVRQLDKYHQAPAKPSGVAMKAGTTPDKEPGVSASDSIYGSAR